MKTKILIAHASGEEEIAEKLAVPLRDAGYDVAHKGTVLVGDSVVAEASKLLSIGTPVVLCATVRAMGTKWARQLANAARHNTRLFVVQMEQEAAVEAIGDSEIIALHWQDGNKAISDLLKSLRTYYPVEADEDKSDLTLSQFDFAGLAMSLPICDEELQFRTIENNSNSDTRMLPIPLMGSFIIAPDAFVELQRQINDHLSRVHLYLKKQHARCWAEVESWTRTKSFSGNESDKARRYRSVFAKLCREEPQPSYNVVLVGPTGNGKTTLLNQLRNLYGCEFLDLETLSYLNAADLSSHHFDVPTYKKRFYGGDRRIIFIDAFDKILIAPTRHHLLEAAQIIQNVTRNYDAVICSYRSQISRSTSERIFSKYSVLQLGEIDARVLDAYLSSSPERQAYHSVLKSNEKLLALSRNPLLLRLLEELHQSGLDIQEITYRIEVFEILVNNWLDRDRGPTLLYREAALSLLERLAGKILESGNGQFRHEDIVQIIAEKYPKADHQYLEKVDFEIRNCTFLSLRQDDNFSFIHPMFYEYCCCRTLIGTFNKLEAGSILAIRLTEDIIDMFVEHIKISEKIEIAVLFFEELWGKQHAAHVYNLLFILPKLGRSPNSLSEREFDQIDFGLFEISFSEREINNSVFKNCDFSDVTLERVKFKNCRFVGCKFSKPRHFEALFGACEFRNADIELDDNSKPIFSYYSFIGSTISAEIKSKLKIHGGVLNNTSLKYARERKYSFVMRTANNMIDCAVLEAVIFDENTDVFSIRNCSIDEISLLSAGSLKAKSRPHFSRMALNAIAKTGSGYFRPIYSPYATKQALRGEEFSLLPPMSKTARKKMNRERHKLEQRLARESRQRQH
jgi:hypothetical protein